MNRQPVAATAFAAGSVRQRLRHVTGRGCQTAPHVSRATSSDWRSGPVKAYRLLSGGGFRACVRKACGLLAGAGMLLWPGAVSARVWYVNASARENKATDGTTWERAFPDVQQALDAAAGGDEIWVAAGTYRPSRRADAADPRSATFQLVNTVLMYGGFAGTEAMREERDPALHVTVLSGDLAGDDAGDFTLRADNAYHVVKIEETDIRTLLDGFEVSGGRADLPGGHDGGGGVRITNARVVIRACRFRDNEAGWRPAGVISGGPPDSIGGGAAFLDALSDVQFIKCDFESNRSKAVAGAVLSDGNVLFRACVFHGNSSEGDGGAVRHANGLLDVSYCFFEDNHSSADGGAVAAKSGARILSSHCTFGNNTAQNGGAVYSSFSSMAQLDHTVFASNAAGFGGAWYSTNASAEQFNQCSFTNHTAESGGVYYGRQTSSVRFQQCAYTNNTADWRGGAVYTQAQATTFGECRFSGNTAVGSLGGAVYASVQALEISGSEFQDNAGKTGGAINVAGSHVHVNHSVFKGNHATDGGAIAGLSPVLVIQNCDLSGNASDRGGGAIQVTGGVLEIASTTFQQNEGGDAGAIYNWNYFYHDAVIELRNVSFESNTGRIGTGAGAVGIFSATRLLAEDCLFLRNVSAGYGGGLRLSARVQTAEVRGCIFSRNKAVYGGGISAASTEPLQIVGSTFERNSAAAGGAVYLVYATSDIRGCRFVGNTASLGGGAAWAISGATEIHSTLFSGNQTYGVGGAIVFASPDQGTLSLVGSTVAFNMAGGPGGGLLAAPTASLRSVIIWGNETGGAESIVDEWAQIDAPGSTSISHSLIQGWTGRYGGVGNSGKDPLFVDSTGPDGLPGTGDEDFRLVPNSPAINRGDPDFVSLQSETDLDGIPRVLCGRVDIGAYEFGIGDYNCDHVVELVDFQGWTGCTTGPVRNALSDDCRAFDFDADDDVDLWDFAGWQQVLAAE